jgi:hypothetical protein
MKTIPIGEIVRLPRTEIRGGWAAGHYDFASWQVIPAGRNRLRLQCLASRAIVRDVGDHFLRFWLDYDGPQTSTRYQDCDGRWKNH